METNRGSTLLYTYSIFLDAFVLRLKFCVTDYDVWAEKPVTAKEVIETLSKNVEKTKKVHNNATYVCDRPVNIYAESQKTLLI